MENYQQPRYVQPSGPTIALDLLATPTNTTGTLTGGLWQLTNSVWCHFSMDTAYEVQSISGITPTEAVDYTLTVGAVVLTSGALAVAPDINDLVTALQADLDYAAAPFTIAAFGTDGIKVTWKVVGSQSDTATLTDDVPTAYTTVTVTEGGAAATTSNGLLASGERVLVIPNNSTLSFIKGTGQADGVIRLTQCE